jgi:acetyl-CoA carboxylase biotin carboxylase subunit
MDTAMHQDAVIPPYYDSLVAKLIAHGSDRTEALARMRRALDTLVVEGIKTSAPLHRLIMDHPDFVGGNISTKWLETYLAELEKDRNESH